MREMEGIYRALRTDGGGWTEGYFRTWLKDGKPYISPPDKWTMHEINPETLSRYAERKDRNGKPIFENDILRLRYRTEEPEVVAVVWSEDNLSFMTVSKPDGDFLDYLAELPGMCEVIGNLFDNPELLEGR